MSLELLFIIPISFIFILLLIRFADKLHLVDKPNDRSFHNNPTPRGAGIGFTLASLLYISLWHWQLIVDNYLVFLAILLVLGIGIIDDVINCRPRAKFITLFVAIALLYLSGLQIKSLGVYIGMPLDLPWFLVAPFMLIAVTGFTNSLNLIDGIDGLAGGISIIILATYLAIGLEFDDTLLVVLSSSFILSLAAFMVFNFHPAKIFMGDSGSLTLGFVISILSIKSLDYINPTAVIFIAAIPLLDTMMVMLRRKQRKLSIFKADQNHMHHILFAQKKDVYFTTTMLWMLQLIFSIIGFRGIGQDDMWNILLYLLLFFVFFSLFDPRSRKRKNKFIRKIHKKEKQ